MVRKELCVGALKKELTQEHLFNSFIFAQAVLSSHNLDVVGGKDIAAMGSSDDGVLQKKEIKLSA